MVASWVVVQSTWLKRELEREFVDGIFKREHFQERDSRERECSRECPSI